MRVTTGGSENSSSLMHGLDILGIVDNHDPNVHCEQLSTSEGDDTFEFLGTIKSFRGLVV